VAGQSNELTGDCVVDGAEAVSDALDASMFIWASIARCGKNGEVVKCEIGVSSAITAMNSMVNVILKSVNKCGVLNTVNKDCGISIAMLTKHAGGITSASGGIAQKCFQGPAHGLNWNHGDAAQCVVNVKNTAKNMFKVIKSFLKLEKTQACASGDTNACAENALQIVGAFAGVGEFLAGTVGQCSPSGMHKGSVCGQQATRLVQQLTEFSERAVDVSQKCANFEPPARLYSAKGPQVRSGSTAGFTNLVLAAFLPLTAIVGFYGGRKSGRHSSQTREVLTDEE
jgi:hypothetical protein